MTTTATARYLTTAVTPAAAVITGHLWLAVVAAAVPCVLACITAIVLVLSVDRGKRVEAIKALPPVITAVRKNELTGRRIGHASSRPWIPREDLVFYAIPTLPDYTSTVAGAARTSSGQDRRDRPGPAAA